MGVKERRQRHKESLRQEVLDAARDLFVQEGYQNVSMRKIAERIEYSPTTIYLHFKDKAELLECICEETFAQLLAELQAIRVETDDPFECLRRGMRTYVEFGLANPNHYILTFMTPLPVNELDEFNYEGSVGASAFGELHNMVATCVATGKIRLVDVDVASQALWAAVHGVTSLLIAHSAFPFVEHDALIDHLINISTESLR